MYVVDVGAFVGDSSIYFAIKGAKKVIAVEPHPRAFVQLLDNIRLNDLETVIIPINVALGEQGHIEVPLHVPLDHVIDKIYQNENKPNVGMFKVKSITLSELLSNLNIKPDVLKLDCEGCEWPLLTKEYHVVKRFNQLAIEYHPYITGINVDYTIKTLSKDFRCRVLSYLDDTTLIYCIKR